MMAPDEIIEEALIALAARIEEARAIGAREGIGSDFRRAVSRVRAAHILLTNALADTPETVIEKRDNANRARAATMGNAIRNLEELARFSDRQLH